MKMISGPYLTDVRLPPGLLAVLLLSVVLPATAQICSSPSGPFVESAPDSFESDNDQDNAGAIFVVAGEQQEHTFHDANDVDWYVFAGTAGQSHDFTFGPFGSLIGSGTGQGAGLVITIFNASGTVVFQVDSLDIQDFVCVGDDLEFSFEPASDALYFMEVRRDQEAVFGAEASYRVGVFINVGLDPGKLMATIVDSTTRSPVSQAIIFLAGSPITVSDKFGIAVASASQGMYTASVEHPDFDTTSVSYELFPLQTTQVTVELDSNQIIYRDGFE